MKKYTFSYGILGHRFLSQPTISEYAFNPGNAELNALLRTQAKYPGELITYFSRCK